MPERCESVPQRDSIGISEWIAGSRTRPSAVTGPEGDRSAPAAVLRDSGPWPASFDGRADDAAGDTST